MGPGENVFWTTQQEGELIMLTLNWKGRQLGSDLGLV